jgi:16S rRNA (guanine966-N2)-methyltransferase
MKVLGQRGKGSVRIIGGQWRGRRLPVPIKTNVRPTPDRVRETVFNWLADKLVGADCLDLFAGSGALGFEALSRGARSAVFVERDRVLVSLLEANKKTLGADRALVAFSDVAAFLQRPLQLDAASERAAHGLVQPDKFGVVFLDPPYEQPLAPLLGSVARRLSSGGLLYAERPASEGLPETEVLRWLRRSRAGRIEFGLAELRPA